MNGYNFTDKVRGVLALARAEAQRLHHPYIGTEHLLLGLTGDETSLGATVLEQLGIDMERIRDTLEQVVPPGKPNAKIGPDLPYTSRAKKVLELAMAEAHEMNWAYVGTEHLLVGLLREEKGIGAQVLVGAGLTVALARAEIARILSAPSDGVESGELRPESDLRPSATPITGAEYRPGIATPRNALAQFYAAFNGRDMELMSTNWARGDFAVMDNPLGGIARGWDAVQAIYERIFQGPVRVQVEFHDFTLHQVGHIAYAVGRERGTAERDGTSLALAIRTTRIFRGDGLEWHQVHHHGSFDDPDMLRAYQQLVNGA